MSNVTRTKEINDLFQWSNNNSANDNLDGEKGRQNRLKTTGFKGNGSGYANSEKIHAADFNFIFHHLAKDLFNIDASITELYKFVQSNRDEITTNSRTHGAFVTRYERERTEDNGRVTALETYKESANQWTWIKNKIENSGESLELGNVKIKNKNGAVNANLNFQYNDNVTTHSLFVNGDNHFGLWNSSNGNIWKVDGAGRVNFSNDIVLGDGNNPKYIANVHRPNSTHDAANKEYVDEKTANVAKTNTANTFEGITTFNQTVEFGGVLATISATPTQNTQITNKAYVDNKFLNVEYITTSSGEKYAANKKYVDDQKAATLREVDEKLRNIPTPTAGTHAANMSYVNTRLDNVATPTQPRHAANKEYVDDKLSRAVVVTNQNTFTADQIIGDDRKIIFGDGPATFSIGKESQNLKLKYGDNDIAEFELIGGELQSGTLKEYIDTSLGRKANSSDLNNYLSRTTSSQQSINSSLSINYGKNLEFPYYSGNKKFYLYRDDESSFSIKYYDGSSTKTALKIKGYSSSDPYIESEGAFKFDRLLMNDGFSNIYQAGKKIHTYDSGWSSLVYFGKNESKTIDFPSSFSVYDASRSKEILLVCFEMRLDATSGGWNSDENVDVAQLIFWGDDSYSTNSSSKLNSVVLERKFNNSGATKSQTIFSSLNSAGMIVSRVGGYLNNSGIRVNVKTAKLYDAGWADRENTKWRYRWVIKYKQ